MKREYFRCEVCKRLCVSGKARKEDRKCSVALGWGTLGKPRRSYICVECHDRIKNGDIQEKLFGENTELDLLTWRYHHGYKRVTEKRLDDNLLKRVKENDIPEDIDYRDHPELSTAEEPVKVVKVGGEP